MLGGVLVAHVLCHTERSLEDRVCDWAKSRGILAFKFEVSGQRGWPDRIFIYKGRCAFIEFKAKGCVPIGIQKLRLRTLCDGGTPAIWTDSYETAIGFLHEQLSPSSLSS